MNCGTPGLPVHHQLLEFTQTHAHRVGDAIQPSHPLSSPSLLPPNPPSIRVFSNESALRMRWPKYWSFSFSGWGIDLDYHDTEWFALETKRDHSIIFEIALKYCVLDSFVDYDGYSISSKEFLPTVVDIMVI